MEVGGVELLAVFALEEGRAPDARIVARARALDLDHVGAEVRQNLTGPRTRENAREFDDFQPLEWFQRSLPFLPEERISYTCGKRASPSPFLRALAGKWGPSCCHSRVSGNPEPRHVRPSLDARLRGHDNPHLNDSGRVEGTEPEKRA